MKEEIFISTMAIFLVFNVIYLSINDTAVNNMLIGSLSSVIIIAITTAVTSGITVMGSGISDSAVKIIFSALIILNVLFQVNVYGFTIGMGLASNIYNVFLETDASGIGLVIVASLSFMAFFCGMLIVAESG